MESILKQPGRQLGSRNYPQEFKRQVAQVASEPQVSVSKLALARGLNANLVFRWRRQYRAGQFGAVHAEHVAAAPIEADQFHAVSLTQASECRMASVLQEERSGLAGIIRLSLPRGN